MVAAKEYPEIPHTHHLDATGNLKAVFSKAHSALMQTGLSNASNICLSFNINKIK